MRTMQSVLTPVGLVVILVAGLRGGDMTSGAFAFMAFLILAVVTYPPADPRRGHQAAMILASAIGLLDLGLLFEEVRAGAVMAQAVNDLLMLVGAGMVVIDAASRLPGDQEDRVASGWSHRTDRAQPVPPLSRG